MIYVIMRETYAWPVSGDAKPLQVIGPIEAKCGFEAVRKCAEELAAKFNGHGFEGEPKYAYYWGHDKDASTLCRFVIRSVTPSGDSGSQAGKSPPTPTPSRAARRATCC